MAAASGPSVASLAASSDFGTGPSAAASSMASQMLPGTGEIFWVSRLASASVWR